MGSKPSKASNFKNRGEIQSQICEVSVEQKLEYLVYRYVLKEIKHLEMEGKYPSELNIFIIQFLGNILMQFDLFNQKYKEHVKNYGTLIIKQVAPSDDNYFSVLSSTTFTAGDIGEFKIKCIKPGGDSIGITSNTDIILDKYTSQYHADCMFTKPVYYYRGGGYLNKAEGEGIRGQTNVSKFHANDIITVKVDCVKWKVSFMNNDEVQGGDASSIDIEPNEIYHPFIGLMQGNVEYELVQ